MDIRCWEHQSSNLNLKGKQIQESSQTELRSTAALGESNVANGMMICKEQEDSERQQSKIDGFFFDYASDL